MPDLLSSLPGGIPGLFRNRSPVLIDFWRADSHDIDAEVEYDPEIDGRPEDYQCKGTIFDVEGETLHVAWLGSGSKEGGTDEIHYDWMVLDLTDPTGRVHAAWWCAAHVGLQRWQFWETGHPKIIDTWSAAEDDILVLAQRGMDMTPEQIDILARLVLRLAGRA